MGKDSHLLEAARTGNLQVISSYITKLKSSSSRPKSRRKLSLFALPHGQSYRTHSLNKGAGLDCSDLNGETPLHLATLNNHKAAIILLMNGGAHADVRDNQGCLPLHLAAWTGNVDICKTLLLTMSNSDVNAQVYGNGEFAEFIMNKSGDTALHIASQYGHTATVRLLLQHEANPMIRNIRGESSLDLSAFYGRLETVSLLVNDQPALLQQIQHSHSPLHLAARNGQKEVVRNLLQAGYNINAKTMSGSALHEAATYGKIEVIRLLVQSGIDKSIKDKNNQTAEELLASHNSAMSTSLLRILQGHENVYHSLSPTTEMSPHSMTSANVTTSTPRLHTCSTGTPRQKLCKHGKLFKEEAQHKRTRERSSSGRTSGSGSPPPTSPPIVLSTNNVERISSRHKMIHSEQRSDFRSSERVSPLQIAELHKQSSSQRYIRDNRNVQSTKCRCGHNKQPNESQMRSQFAAVGLEPSRHKSSPTPISNPRDTFIHSSSFNASIQGHAYQEKMRHKSASAVPHSMDYLKLSDAISFTAQPSTDNHVYNSIMQPINDHCYEKVNASISPIYDTVPKPHPVQDNESADGPPVFSSLSPSSHSSHNNHDSTDVFSCQSEDSVYNSPGSLSPEFNGPLNRKHLGHIYVNLTRYRSTPDIYNLSSLEAPKKPPRTDTLDIDVTERCKSTDYVCVDINPLSLSRSQEMLGSDSSLGDRLPSSVPACDNSTQQFLFPPIASLAKPEDDDDEDIHEYENMITVITEHKPRQPPKAMPRKSKSKLDSLSSASSNNNCENTFDAELLAQDESCLGLSSKQQGECGEMRDSTHVVFSTEL